ncbi:MAG: diaminopimelate epimerase, partial [Pseudomonadota bacterium]
MAAMSHGSDTEPSGLAFRKMHGLGNDFVVVDQRHARVPLAERLVQAIGDRHRGVGFDQLTEILPGEDTDVALTFWNADGSTAGACGNATRCIAGWLMEDAGTEVMTLRTERGRLTARRRPDGVVEVDMGPPSLDWSEIPLAEDVDTGRLPIDGDPAAAGMGNPHCTFFVDDADSVDLVARGGEMEHHPLFPERTNVQFVQVLAPDRARVRVWERGVGVTLASG